MSERRHEPSEGSAAPSGGFITIRPEDVVADPYPHAIKQGMLREDFYRRLRSEFPSDELFDGRGSRFGARTGRDLYRGDPGFEEFLSGSGAWQEFYDYVNSPAFLQYTLSLFGPHLERFQCRIDPGRAHLVDHVEGRFSTWWRSRKARWFGWGRDDDADELFVRFDLEQSGTGYDKPVHCDNPSRLVSMIVYFCDAEEIGMEGGVLRVHEHLERKAYRDYERMPPEDRTKVVRELVPRENLGAFFLCSNNSYHSVTAVRSIRDYRRFIYLNLSSTAEHIW